LNRANALYGEGQVLSFAPWSGPAIIHTTTDIMGMHINRYRAVDGVERSLQEEAGQTPLEGLRVRSTAVPLIPGMTYNGRVQDQPLFVKEGRKYHRVHLSDILYVEAQRGYVKLCARNREHLLHNYLSAVMAHLPVNMFCMVNRSQAVNVLKLESISNHEVQVEGRTFELSPRFRPKLLELLPIVSHR
jgi:DNA-binding LytR/AlgR family response regulator